MQRFSISFDDELAAWVESQAEERGVSKAKIIRDAVATVRESDTDLVQTGDVIARLEDLERRVDALEQARQEAIGDELAKAVAEESDLDVSIGPDSEGKTIQTATGTPPSSARDDLFETVRDYLADRPPQSTEAEAAILTAWKQLREKGRAETAELRAYVYERHGEGYANEHSLWQSIQRYFDDVPGVQKSGHGEWAYTGDETVRDELRE